MSSQIYKHRSTDKDDGFMPPKNQFLHDDWRVSNYSESFHAANAYGYRMRGSGWYMGTHKKIWMASSHGDKVDGYNNCGKSDNQ